MSQYMFLLFDDESWYDDLTPEKWAFAMKIHDEFAKAVEAAGARIVQGAALERSSTATTVRRDWNDMAAQPVITDGPFVETKEALGGFYLVEARDLDEALGLAAQCPSGYIEVRPVFDTSQLPG